MSDTRTAFQCMNPEEMRLSEHGRNHKEREGGNAHQTEPDTVQEEDGSRLWVGSVVCLIRAQR